MRQLVLAVAVGFIPSCVSTTVEYRREISGLTEMSADYITTQWGEPDYILPTTSGRTIKFERVLFDEQDPITDEIIKQVCTVSLNIDKESIVQDWNQESCLILNPKPQTVETESSEGGDGQEFDMDERKLPDVDLEDE